MSTSIVAIKDFFPASVTAYYTTRIGRSSKYPYSHFNLSDNVGDNPESVKRNRKLLLNYVKCKPVWLKQVHSNKVFDIDSFVEQEFIHGVFELPVADSSLTSKMYRSSVILTADCLPILVSSHEGDVIGSIHCGWKGLLKGIIGIFFKNFFFKLNKLKKTSENVVYVWLGPCISQEFYAVSTELEKQFVRSETKFKQAFQEYEKQTFMDIRHIAKYQIKEVLRHKVNGEFNSHDICTYKNETYFSYRRESRTGRHAHLFLKIKLDKQTHIEVQYYLTG